MLNLPLNVRRVAIIIGIIMLVFIVLDFNRRLEELNLLNKQNDAVQTQATQAIQTQSALQTQVAFAGSTAAVDEWARTEGHLVTEGDQPVIPVSQPGSAPVIVNTPVPIPTPMQNWQVWWTLFFDKK